MKCRRSIFVISLFSIHLTCLSQMPVEQEPHHKVVFKNDYIRILDLKIAPGDTTLVHKHDAASVVLFLSKSKFGIRNADGSLVIADVKPGDIVYRAYDEKPVVHSVLTEDGSVFRCMVVEILKHAVGKDSCSGLSGKGIKLNWHEKLVSAYTLHISTGKDYKVPTLNCAQLLIVFSGSVSFDLTRGKIQMLDKNGFHFFPKQNSVEIKCDGVGAADCILLELR